MRITVMKCRLELLDGDLTIKERQRRKLRESWLALVEQRLPRCV